MPPAGPTSGPQGKRGSEPLRMTPNEPEVVQEGASRTDMVSRFSRFAARFHDVRERVGAVALNAAVRLLGEDEVSTRIGTGSKKSQVESPRGIPTTTEDFREAILSLRLIFDSLNDDRDQELDDPAALHFDRFFETVSRSSFLTRESTHGIIILEHGLIRWSDGTDINIRDVFEEALHEFSPAQWQNIITVRQGSLIDDLPHDDYLPIQHETLFTLFKRTLRSLLKEKIDKHRGHRPGSDDPFQALPDGKTPPPGLSAQPKGVAKLYLPSGRVQVVRPAMPEILMRGRMERLFRQAHEHILPSGMVLSDVFNDDNYLEGRVESTRRRDVPVLNIFTESSLTGLLEMTSEMGSFEQIKPWIQWFQLPENALPAIVDRVLIGLKRIRTHAELEQQEFTLEDQGEDESLTDDDLWYIVGRVRESVAGSGSIEEALAKIFPGVDHEYLINSAFMRERFENLATAFAVYFHLDPNNAVEGDPIGLLLYSFFDALAKDDHESWEGVMETFSCLKSIAVTPANPREAMARANVLQGWDPLLSEKNTGDRVLKNPELFDQVAKLVSPIRRNHAIVINHSLQRLIGNAPLSLGLKGVVTWDPEELVKVIKRPGVVSAVVEDHDRFGVVSVVLPK